MSREPGSGLDILPGAAPAGSHAYGPDGGAASVGQRLRVDPVACDGIGMCAHLAAGLVTLDSWGYPVVPTHTLDASETKQASKAVAGCPRRALMLDSR